MFVFYKKTTRTLHYSSIRYDLRTIFSIPSLKLVCWSLISLLTRKTDCFSLQILTVQDWHEFEIPYKINGNACFLSLSLSICKYIYTIERMKEEINMSRLIKIDPRGWWKWMIFRNNFLFFESLKWTSSLARRSCIDPLFYHWLKNIN